MPRAEFGRLACESGMVRRRRKVDPSAMVWTLTLGVGTGRERTLAGLRRMYRRATGTSLAPSAFYDRFTPELVRLLCRVVGELCGRVSEHEPARSGLLAKFADVMMADATVVKLHRLQAKRYPGTRRNSSPAAAKLHVVMSVTGRGVQRVKLTGERSNDHRTLRMGPWVRDRLLLFGLGFFRYQLFDCIDRNGGYFVSRLPASANPRIVGVHRRWRGRAVELAGRRLDEVADRLKREILDVEVQVEFRRRVYAGHRRMDRQRLRLVGVRDADTRSYWFYLTNIAPHDLDANDWHSSTRAAGRSSWCSRSSNRITVSTSSPPARLRSSKRCCWPVSSRCWRAAGCSMRFADGSGDSDTAFQKVAGLRCWPAPHRTTWT